MIDDADEIRRRLTDRLEQLLDRYHPNHVVRGARAYLSVKGPKDLGSFQVNLRGPRRGQFYRFSQRVGGGSVELLAYTLTGNPKAYDVAFKEARAFLGISNERPAENADLRARRENEREQAERKRARQEEEEKRRRARRADTAAGIWAECAPIAGTVAEDYLVDRGIPVPPGGWPACVGFHAGLEWELGARFQGDTKVEEGPQFPCLVGRVDDATDEPVAIWRIFLDPLTGGKADVETPKLGLGPARGGAIRIGGVAARIGVAEGVETAFGAWSLVGRRHPVWASLSTSGMAGLELPLAVEEVIIFPDGDRPIRRDHGEYVATAGGAGILAARALRGRLVTMGIACTIEAEPAAGTDYLDIWNAFCRLESA